MNKERMTILRLLWEQDNKGKGPIPAGQLWEEQAQAEFPKQNKYKRHVEYLIRKRYVYEHTTGNRIISIDAPGIDYYEHSLKPWKEQMREALTDPVRFAGFIYGAATTLIGVIIGTIIGYLLGSP